LKLAFSGIIRFEGNLISEEWKASQEVPKELTNQNCPF